MDRDDDRDRDQHAALRDDERGYRANDPGGAEAWRPDDQRGRPEGRHDWQNRTDWQGGRDWQVARGGGRNEWQDQRDWQRPRQDWQSERNWQGHDWPEGRRNWSRPDWQGSEHDWQGGRQLDRRFDPDSEWSRKAFSESERDDSFGGYRSERHGMRGDAGRGEWAPHARASQTSSGQGTQSRGLHYGKGPAGFERSDDRIREAVGEALTDHGDIDATHIHIEVRGGEVTLSGTVADRRMKRLAEDCVDGVRGVKDVQNQLRIAIETHAGESPGMTASSAPSAQDLKDKKQRPS